MSILNSPNTSRDNRDRDVQREQIVFLEEILEQLKILNIHLSSITEIESEEIDNE